MAEFEELKLSVNLVDNASTGLANIRQQIENLKGSAGSVSESFNRIADSAGRMGAATRGAVPHVAGADKAMKDLTKSAEETGRGLMQMALSVRGGVGALPQLALGLREATTGFSGLKTAMALVAPEAAAAVAGLVGVGIAITAVGVAATMYGVAVFRFAQEMNKLNQTAKELGIGLQTLKNLTDEGERFGHSSEQVIQGLVGISEAMGDLSHNNSQLRRSLLSEGVNAQFIDQIARQNDPRVVRNMVRQYGLMVKQERMRQGSSELAATNDMNSLGRKFGQDPSLFTERATPGPDPAKAGQFKFVAEQSKMISDTWADIKETLSSINLDVMTVGLPLVNVALEAIWGTAKLIEGAFVAIKVGVESMLVAAELLSGDLAGAWAHAKQIGLLGKSYFGSIIEHAKSGRPEAETAGPAAPLPEDQLPAAMQRAPHAAAPGAAPLAQGPAIPPAATAVGNVNLGAAAANDNARALQTATTTLDLTDETAKNTTALAKLTRQIELLIDWVSGSGGVGAAGAGGGGALARIQANQANQTSLWDQWTGGGGTPGAGTQGGGGSSGGGGASSSYPASGGNAAGAAGLPSGGTGAAAAGVPGAGGGAGGGDLDKDAYDKMFKGTPLEGKYDKVVETAKANGVPASLMAGIIAHETGKGTSKMLRDRNNPAGLMDPATGMKTGKNFPSVDAGIEAAGKTIAKNYQAGGGTIAGMQKSYAPVGAANDPGGLNSGWVGGVTKYSDQLGVKGGADNPLNSGTVSGAGGTASPPTGGELSKEIYGMTMRGAQPHEIQAAMQRKGINLNIATCGQFMAAAVKERGGTPPQNPATASEWNRFGGKEGAGWSDDPNAINIAVRQGTPTGLGGSHVGEATKNPDGSYSITGVNQGLGRGVISKHGIRIGNDPRAYQIRHQIVQRGGNVPGAAAPTVVPGGRRPMPGSGEPTDEATSARLKAMVGGGGIEGAVPQLPPGYNQTGGGGDGLTPGWSGAMNPALGGIEQSHISPYSQAGGGDSYGSGIERKSIDGFENLDEGRKRIDAASGAGGVQKHEGSLNVRVSGTPSEVDYNGTGLLRQTSFERSSEGQLTKTGPRAADDSMAA